MINHLVSLEDFNLHIQMVGISSRSLMAGMFTLIAIVGALMGLYVLLDISGLTVGTVTQVATSGQINVSTQMGTHLTALEADYISDAESVTANSALIISLVAIVVIILVFGMEDFFKNFMNAAGSGSGKGGVM